MTVWRLLDTGALLSYAENDDPHVGFRLAYCSDRGWLMQTSALCVAEAYQAASEDGVSMLDILLSLPQVEVIDCFTGDGRITGLLGKHVGRLGLAHSCLLAMSGQTPLFTAEAAEASRVLESFLIEEMPKD
jgi:hypothetical protein